MGEVYRALDTNLARQVAIKILPDSVAHDAERLARFDREAKTLATLNHPNIAQIFGLESADGIRALVMELIEGPTLADRIGQGSLPVDEAVAIARQIVDALETAHEQGVVHRDLKPANIKLRPDGAVKVLDFGLAKILEPPSAEAVDSAPSTITSPALMTRAGVLLGTAAYMSPEQARGRPVDRRADIWAFGCVLYEMLTGRRPFEGEDVSLTLSRILQSDPDFHALPADLPPHVRQTMHLCLQKSLKDRISDMGSVRLMLTGAFEHPSFQTTRHVADGRATWRRAILFLLTAIAAAALGGLGVWRLMPARVAAPQRVVRFTLPTSSSIAPRGAGMGRHILALSPQGTDLVYWADNNLHVRTLGHMDASTPLRGTEGAREPFFSPDGRWIGFQQQDQLKRMPLEGGASLPLGPTENPWGASWGTDGVIRFGQGARGIWQTSPNSGAPTQLIAVRQGEQAHGPQLLPDGNWVLFTLLPASQDSWDQAQIVVQSLASGERTVLLDRGRDARYLPTGHLLYGLNGALLGVPFDARARRITGPAVPLIEGVMDSDVRTGAMHFTVSNDGTLAYLSGGSGERARLSWVDRTGRQALPADAHAYSSPRVSPDGTRIAVEVQDRDGVDIHIYDVTRNTLTRLTSAPAHGRYPLWTPDGSRMVFYSDANGGGLYSVAADGSGPLKRLTASRAVQVPYSWTDRGRTLLMDQRSVDRIGAADIYALSLDAGSSARPLLQTAAHEGQAAVSPDGRWLAYAETEGDTTNVFVRPFPRVDGGRWQVSTGDGDSPLWSRDGKQLFYISQGRAMSVPVTTSPAFLLGQPSVLFELPPFYRSLLIRSARQWDLAPGGERFVIVNPGDLAASDVSQPRIVVVLNWFDELKRLVPVK